MKGRAYIICFRLVHRLCARCMKSVNWRWWLKETYERPVKRGQLLLYKYGENDARTFHLAAGIREPG